MGLFSKIQEQMRKQQSAPYKGVFLTSPLDFFDCCSVPVEKWLADDNCGTTGAERHIDYAAAYAAYNEASGNSHRETLRQVYVAYDMLKDASFFIFKQDNNGNTIVVSNFPQQYPPHD